MGKVTARWTGSYPCLCSGEWIITVDGIRLTGIDSDSFGTYGQYSSWSFGEDWSEDWDDYEDGMILEEWIKNPPNGLLESLKLHCIPATEELLSELYHEINACDWRSGSCGGCI